MRTAPFAFLFVATLTLTGCTKEAFFSDPAAGTIVELGFSWLDGVESCLDSDDHSRAFCGRATWLDGTRVAIELPSPESIGFDTADPAILEIAESESIRYVYYPSTRSVELVLQSGAIMLHWNEGLGCLEGDVQQDDFLSIWTRAAAPSPGS